MDRIAAVYEYGLMLGSDTGFNPDGSATIGETLAMAARLRDIYYGGEGKFTQGSPWYQVYVDYALENRIIEEDQYSDYGVKAARKDFASILAAAFPTDALSAINHVVSLPDVEKTADYAPAVFLLYNAGILTGSDDKGSFQPESTITRAEVATIVVRMADAASRRTLSFGTQMTAFAFLSDLAETMGDKTQGDDGGDIYSVTVAQLTGLFQTNDGRDFLSTVVVREESDGGLGIVIVDIHPDTEADYPILYSTGIAISPDLAAPYGGAIEFVGGDSVSIGTVSIKDPASFSEDTSVAFEDYEGDSSLKEDLQEDLVEGICNALRVIEKDYLTPYGYSLKDLGFNALAQQ